MVMLTQIAFEVGIEEYIELLKRHLMTIREFQGEKATLRLRQHLFEE